MNSISTGYFHRSYIGSFSEISTPRELPGCGGWILERDTPHLPYRDGMGSYPLFVCQDWKHLASDIEDLSQDLVSLSLVSDPFGDYTPNDLLHGFDNVQRYKEHFVTDLNDDRSHRIAGAHRRNLSKALRQVTLEHCQCPADYLDEWHDLYSHLIARHDIKGFLQFSRSQFEKQLSVPGLFLLRAHHEGKTVGLHSWMVSGDVAYGHLGATNDMGYKLMASYALYWYALETLRGQVRWLDLGAAPGKGKSSGHGLARFKRGWATGTRPVYFCSRIFDHERYQQLLTVSNIGRTEFFPAYRSGEFG